MKKAVIVTGASGDIGKAICSYFIRQGYSVIGIYYKDQKSILELSKILGSDFYFFQCDLSDFDATENLLKEIEKLNLHLELLVNNAGISTIGLLQDLDTDTWNCLWNTNVTSCIAMSKQLIPVFLKNGHGKIINISSVWGNVGASMETAYSATKGAINAFTKALAKELAPSNIQVNAIACGIINTKMNSHLSQNELDDIMEEIPASRIGTPEDIALAVYHLAIAGNYITGQILSVDGGWTV